MSEQQTPIGQVGDAQANPAGQAAPTEWQSGLNDDLKSYVQTKGFKDPASVLDSYRNLEKLVGVKDKLLQVPDNLGDEKAMAAVWDRLGRPTKPEEYGIKSENEAFTKWYTETAHKLGLNRNQAEALFKSYDEYSKAEITAFEAQQKAANEKLVNELKTKWGAAYDQNVSVAKQAAVQFGVDEAMVTKLESVLGFQKTMEFFNAIGSKIGESEFVEGKPASANKAYTPEGAKAKINDLMNDKDFVRKYIDGDQQSRQEMERLNKFALGMQA